MLDFAAGSRVGFRYTRVNLAVLSSQVLALLGGRSVGSSTRLYSIVGACSADFVVGTAVKTPCS